jgi:hypothetical protein
VKNEKNEVVINQNIYIDGWNSKDMCLGGTPVSNCYRLGGGKRDHFLS